MARGDAEALFEVYKALGELTQATLDMREDIKDVKEKQDVAAENRQEMSEEFRDLAARMASFEKKLEDVSDVTDEVKAWKQRGLGALGIVGVGSSALTYIIMHWSTEIVNLLNKKII